MAKFSLSASAQKHLQSKMMLRSSGAKRKPVSKRRRLLMYHRLDAPEDDAIHGDSIKNLQVKVVDDVDKDPFIL